MSEQKNSRAQDERDSNENDLADAGFEMSADDPRSVTQRGGLENIIERSAEPLSYEPSAADLGDPNIGTTGGDFDPKYAGAGATNADTTTAGSGVVNLNTTGSFGQSSQTPGVGPGESVIGTRAPQVEMTDVGLVDVAATDISVTGDDESDDESKSGGARVENERGELL